MLFLLEPQSLLLSDPQVFDKAFGTAISTGRKSSHSVDETQTAYTISIDLPGVEAKDISVTTDDGTLSIATAKGDVFKSFEINPKVADIENIKSSLQDGVLTVIIPKHEPVVIKVSASTADHIGEKDYTVELDIPGVKLEDVSVVLRDNTHLAVQALRHGTAHSKQRKFSKAIAIDTDKFDISKASATLRNGVLVVAVPPKPEADLRTIEVTSTEETPPENKDTADATTEDFHLSMDLPGVKVSDVTIQIQDNKLSISASRTYGNTKKVLKMAKETMLDPLVQSDKLRANLMNGVLTVTAPRNQRPVPKKVEVSSGVNLLQ